MNDRTTGIGADTDSGIGLTLVVVLCRRWMFSVCSNEGVGRWRCPTVCQRTLRRERHRTGTLYKPQLSWQICQLNFLAASQYTPRLRKTSHLWFAITLTHVNGFWYFFDRTVTDEVSNERTLYCATSNNLCFCTTWQSGKHKNCILSLAVIVHCQNSTSRWLISSIFLTHDSYSRCCMTA